MAIEHKIISERKMSKNGSPQKDVGNRIVEEFKKWPHALQWGLWAGLLMGIYLMVLQLAGGGDIIALKFFKYVFLFGFLGHVLNLYRKANRSLTFFQNGIHLGLLTTFVSALSFVAINIVLSLVVPDYSLNKFYQEAELYNLMEYFIINGAIFFEILVFGMIITFIWLQFLKRRYGGGTI